MRAPLLALLLLSACTVPNPDYASGAAGDAPDGGEHIDSDAGTVHPAYLATNEPQRPQVDPPAVGEPYFSPRPPISDLEPVPTCGDGVLNGDETAVDCGGHHCAPCASGTACARAGDCEGGACIQHLCVGDTCSDGVKDGDEEGIDCGGGACPPCP